MIIAKILFFIGSLCSGVYILLRKEYIVREIGHNAWAEKHLGPGGTYTMWQGIAVILMIIGFIFLIGDLDWLINVLYR